MDAKTTTHGAREIEEPGLDELEEDRMTDEELEAFLVQAIRIGAGLDEMAEYEGEPVRIATFEDCGVLTMNRGLVLEIGDSEFQITIVRSR